MFSAAVLQGLHEMRRPRNEITYITMTEEEFREMQKNSGMDQFEIDIAVKMMKAGGHLDGGNGRRISLT